MPNIERRSINFNNITGMDLRDVNINQDKVQEIINLTKTEDGWAVRAGRFDILTGVTTTDETKAFIVKTDIVYVQNGRSIYCYKLDTDGVTLGTLFNKYTFEFDFDLYETNYKNSFFIVDRTNHKTYVWELTDRIATIINDSNNISNIVSPASITVQFTNPHTITVSITSGTPDKWNNCYLYLPSGASTNTGMLYHIVDDNGSGVLTVNETVSNEGPSSINAGIITSASTELLFHEIDSNTNDYLWGAFAKFPYMTGYENVNKYLLNFKDVGGVGLVGFETQVNVSNPSTKRFIQLTNDGLNSYLHYTTEGEDKPEVLNKVLISTSGGYQDFLSHDGQYFDVEKEYQEYGIESIGAITVGDYTRTCVYNGELYILVPSIGVYKYTDGRITMFKSDANIGYAVTVYKNLLVFGFGSGNRIRYYDFNTNTFIAMGTTSATSYTPRDLIEFNGKLYFCDGGNGVYVYDDSATTWAAVTITGGPANGYNSMCVYKDKLYIGSLAATSGEYAVIQYDGTTVTKLLDDTYAAGLIYQMKVIGDYLYILLTDTPGANCKGRTKKYDGSTFSNFPSSTVLQDPTAIFEFDSKIFLFADPDVSGTSYLYNITSGTTAVKVDGFSTESPIHKPVLFNNDLYLLQYNVGLVKFKDDKIDNINIYAPYNNESGINVLKISMNIANRYSVSDTAITSLALGAGAIKSAKYVRCFTTWFSSTGYAKYIAVVDNNAVKIFCLEVSGTTGDIASNTTPVLTVSNKENIHGIYIAYNPYITLASATSIGYTMFIFYDRYIQSVSLSRTSTTALAKTENTALYQIPVKYSELGNSNSSSSSKIRFTGNYTMSVFASGITNYLYTIDGNRVIKFPFTGTVMTQDDINSISEIDIGVFKFCDFQGGFMDISISNPAGYVLTEMNKYAGKLPIRPYFYESVTTTPMYSTTNYPDKLIMGQYVSVITKTDSAGNSVDLDYGIPFDIENGSIQYAYSATNAVSWLYWNTYLMPSGIRDAGLSNMYMLSIETGKNKQAIFWGKTTETLKYPVMFYNPQNLMNGTDSSKPDFLALDKIFYFIGQTDYDWFQEKEKIPYVTTKDFNFEAQGICNIYNGASSVNYFLNYDRKNMYYVDGFNFINPYNRAGFSSKPVAVAAMNLNVVGNQAQSTETYGSTQVYVLCENDIYVSQLTDINSIQTNKLSGMLGLEKDNRKAVVTFNNYLFFQNQYGIYMINQSQVVNIGLPMERFLYKRSTGNKLGIDGYRNYVYVPLDKEKIDDLKFVYSSAQTPKDYEITSGSSISYDIMFGVFDFVNLSWKIYAFNDTSAADNLYFANLKNNLVLRMESKLTIPEYEKFKTHDGTCPSTAGAVTTITLAANESTDTDYYKNCYVALKSGVGKGQVRKITGYSGKVATVTPQWTASGGWSRPLIGETYQIQTSNENPICRIKTKRMSFGSQFEWTRLFTYLTRFKKFTGSGIDYLKLVVSLNDGEGTYSVKYGDFNKASAYSDTTLFTKLKPKTPAGVEDTSLGWEFVNLPMDLEFLIAQINFEFSRIYDTMYAEYALNHIDIDYQRKGVEEREIF